MHDEDSKRPQCRPVPVGAAAFVRDFFRMPLTAPRRTVDVLTFMPADTIAWAQWRASGVILYGTLPPASALGDDVDVHRFAAMIAAELSAHNFAGTIVTEGPLPGGKNSVTALAAKRALMAIELAAERRSLAVLYLSQAQVGAACGASDVARIALEAVVRGEGLGATAEGGPSVRECQAVLWACVGGMKLLPEPVQPRPQPKAVTSPKAFPGEVKAARQAAAIATYNAIRGSEAAPKATTKRKPQLAAGMPKPRTKAQLAAIRARKVAIRKEAGR